MKIRTKLALIVSMAISVALLVLGSVSYLAARRTIRDLTVQSNRRILQQINLSIDANVQEIERVSRSIYSNAETRQALGLLASTTSGSNLQLHRTIVREGLMAMTAMRDDFVGIYYFPDGSEMQPVFVRKGWALRPDYDVRSEPWYGRVMVSRGEKMVIGSHEERQPLRDPEIVFSLIRRVRDVDSGEGIGILLINVSNRVVEDICSGAAFQEGSEIVLVGPGGRISYHTDRALIGAHADVLNTPLKFETAGTREIAGESSLFTANHSAFSGFTAISVVPYAVLDRSSNQIKWTTVGLVSLGIAIAVLLSRLFSLHITRPINELQDLMKIAETGDFHIPVPVERADEVGDLARHFDFMMRRINELVRTVYEVRIRNQEAQLEVLQSKINPHFLYNTLDTIRGMALKIGAEEIIDVVESLAHLFRYSMEIGADLIPLSREMEYMRHYLRIQTHRHGRRFVWEVNVPDNLSAVPVPRLLLQPVVENAIYHGMEGASPGTRIEITARTDGSYMTLLVRDDGNGMDGKRLGVIREAIRADAERFPEGFPVRTGIGILNVHGRLRKRFGPPCGLEIESKAGDGTRVVLTIPRDGEGTWNEL